MRHFYHYISFILLLILNYFPVAVNASDNISEINILFNDLTLENTSLISINNIGSDKLVRLIHPAHETQISTFTPTFSWHAIQADDPVEYRLIIAKPDGKIVFDEWIGQDTSYTIPISNKLEDLTPYYWTIYASYSDNQIQSLVWSFWIDQNIVTDLTVSDINLINEKQDWNTGDQIKIKVTVQNAGPVDAESCYITLYSGNINRNYWDYSAHRKTIALDTVLADVLKINEPKSVILTARLPYGFNHLFIHVDPGTGLKDIIDSNNYLGGIKIQTEDRVLNLNGLIMIYKNYADPEFGEKRLEPQDLNQLYQNINNFQRYFWDHTLILQISVDTLSINRLLTDDNFTYQDDRWGYFLSPEEVKFDLEQRNVKELSYDFIFVYYSWWNSTSSWSAYSGYTFRDFEFFDKEISFLAQPLLKEQIGNEKIIIHEFFHLLEHLFKKNGESKFYSPHHRTLYTTFEKDEEYFDWILETWPTVKWFNLKQGQLINREEMDQVVRSNINFHLPETLILSQNYPNPFNKITDINYKIPQFAPSTKEVKVTLIIYDVLGNQIRTLVNEFQEKGTYRIYWDGHDQAGREVASGIYFYVLRAGKQRQVKKLIYIQ